MGTFNLWTDYLGLARLVGAQREEDEPETRLDLGGPPVDAVLRMLASLLSAVGAAEPF